MPGSIQNLVKVYLLLKCKSYFNTKFLYKLLFNMLQSQKGFLRVVKKTTYFNIFRIISLKEFDPTNIV